MITVEDQTPYDVAIQELGAIEEIGEVLSRITDPNVNIPFGTSLDLPDTFDVPAKNRIFNNVKIATGITIGEEGIGYWAIEIDFEVQ